MRVLAIVFLYVCWLAIGPARSDDLKVNTPIMVGSLMGKWKLQTGDTGKYEQTLQLQAQFFGQWQQSRETLPVSIAWFVEGGELRILHYYDPDGSSNYRVKSRMVPYALSKDELTLTIDGKSTAWKRIEKAADTKVAPK